MRHSKPLLSAALVALCAGQVHAQSAFGCGDLGLTSNEYIEGQDGVFFRIFADLRLQHPLDDQVVDQLARLADKLEENGTTLVYVTIPSKSQVLPELLPPLASDYGFDLATAEYVYDDITGRLNAAGIMAPDIMRALRQGDGTSDELPFFRADFHWSSEGARRAAQAIGAAIRANPAAADIPVTAFESIPQGVEVAFSGMRRNIQSYCKLPLPSVTSMAWKTQAGVDADAPLDIFAAAPEAPAAGGLDIFGGASTTPAVLIGTSFSDSAINNFAGWLSQYAQMEVLNYSITGGNQFGAITSYLTSADYEAQRPTFLIWENPIYNNIGQFGPQAMEELIAAVGTDCTTPLPVTAQGSQVTASLDGLRLNAGDALMVDFGAEGARRAEFVLTTASGIKRHALIERGDRLRATGRFWLSMGPFAMSDLASVEVTFDREVTSQPSLNVCFENGDSL